MPNRCAENLRKWRAWWISLNFLDRDTKSQNSKLAHYRRCRFLDSGHALFYTLSFKKTFSLILSGVECID